VYTHHPCIIREATAAIKENPERINENDGVEIQQHTEPATSPLPELQS
jgi:hypothetical protein